MMDDTPMPPVRFPPGQALLAGRTFDDKIFPEVDRLILQGSCPDGRLEIETASSRLTCLIHGSRPYLAGLQEQDFFSWVPLKDFPVRAGQLDGAVCSLVKIDPIRVLLEAVHFRNRPVMQASTELVDLSHVLSVLGKKGMDAALALERSGTRTLLFLQQGKPARLYFGNPAEDPGEGSLTDRFLLYAFSPEAGHGQVEVFSHLKIEPDPDAGTSLVKLAAAAKPPPPTSIAVSLGGRIVLQRPFMSPSMTIGRDHTCELLLDNLSVSRRHARLSWDRGRFVIEDLESANGTLLEGKPVTRSTLTFRERIGIGKFELRLGVASELRHPDATMILSASADESNPGYLVGKKVSLPLKQEIVLGKGPGADAQAEGFWVRAVHARIRPEGRGSFRLSCPGRRKVIVNGKKTNSAMLRFGDRITLGRSQFWLVPTLSGEPTNA